MNILVASILPLLSSAPLPPSPITPQTHAVPPAPVTRDATDVGRPVGLLPRAVTSFGAATADGWVYVFGGYFGRPHDYTSEHQSRDFYRVDALDPSNIELLPGGELVQSATLEPHAGTVVRVGGLHVVDDEFGDLASVATCRRFDPRDGRWSDLPDMPGPRSSHDSVVVGDTLYVVGGWRLEPEADAQWYDEVWTLDLADPDAAWATVPQPFRRRALAVAAVDGRVVVAGGIDEGRDLATRVDVLDTATNEWTTGPDLPGAAFGAAAIGADGAVLLSGNDGVLRRWDLAADAWQDAGRFTFPRFFHQFVAHPAGGVMALGGIGRSGRVRHVEHFGAPATGDPLVATWTVPSPTGTKNRQGMSLVGDELRIFGGNHSTGQHDFEPEHFSRAAWTFDLSDLSFAPSVDYPEARQTISTWRDGDDLYAIGGFGHDGEVARAHAAAYRLDDEEGWVEASFALPESRSQFGVAEHEGEVWIFGGLDYDPRREPDDRFRHVESVIATRAGEDGEREMVDTGVRLPEPRRAFAGAALDGRYYMVGGMREGFELVETCRVFDFASQQWSELPAPSRARLSGTLVPVGGRLYLVGGSSPSIEGRGLEPNSAIEVYDPATGSWSTWTDEIPVPAKHLRAFEFRGRLLLVSSHFDGAGRMRFALIDPVREASSEALEPVGAAR